MSAGRICLEFTQPAETAYALAASPAFARDGICFAATSLGVYRSQDGGDRWTLLDIAPEADMQLAVTAVAVSPAFAQDRTVFAAVKGGILRSSDGGENWFAAKFPAPPPLFSDLAISPDFARDGLLLAGAMEDGVFSSTDRGVTWQPWNFGLLDLGLLCLAASPDLQQDETIFAGVETGLYRSGNGGRAWRETGLPSDCAPILCLAFVTDSPGDEAPRLYAGTEQNGLFLSRDKGASWQRSAPDTLTGAVNQLLVARRANAAADILALADDGLWISCDGGHNWQALLETQDPPSAILAPDGAGKTLFLAQTGQGIFKYEY